MTNEHSESYFKFLKSQCCNISKIIYFKSKHFQRRQVARAQAIAAGILQVNPGGMSNPKEKIPNTYYKNYATNTNNKSSVGHRILVTGMNTEGLKDAKICEMLKGYFEQFGEINQVNNFNQF